MSIRNFAKLFQPATVALIGASERPRSIGTLLARNLRRAGFKGELQLVNPHLGTLDGMPVYRDIASLPRPVDLAIIATPPDTVPGLIAELGARGTRAAVVITAGFGELGERGRALQEAALAAARPCLLRLVGPNCVGIMVPRIGLDASFSHLALAPGTIVPGAEIVVGRDSGANHAHENAHVAIRDAFDARPPPARRPRSGPPRCHDRRL